MQSNEEEFLAKAIQKSSMGIVLTIAFIVLLFSSFTKKDTIPEPEIAECSANELADEFDNFKTALAIRESGNNYKAINTLGYVGKYQFGTSAVTDLKTTKKRLLRSKELQEDAFENLCSINKYRLRNYIDKYAGRTINEIEITEAGMLAAAHLLGSENVKKWLDSDGKYYRTDAYGTSINEYMEKFGIYNISVASVSKVDMSKRIY